MHKIVINLPAPHPLLAKLKNAGITFFLAGKALGLSTSRVWELLSGRAKPTEEQELRLSELAEAAAAGRVEVKR